MSHRGPVQTLPTIAPSIAGLEVGPRRADIDARWQYYEQMAGVHRVVSEDAAPEADAEAESEVLPTAPTGAEMET